MTYDEILKKLNDELPETAVLAQALEIDDADFTNELFELSDKIRKEQVGNKVYLRGLIEYSNHCAKNCYYCGIRRENKKVIRYKLRSEEVLETVKWGLEAGLNSFVIQSGENTSNAFIEEIENLLRKIHQLSTTEPRITLSMGEQSYETYQRWYEAGAKRYLLRIESSNPVLYRSIHPDDGKHTFKSRVEALEHLKKAGYQVGTGVMIGLPGQTTVDLANDIIFFKDFGIDMLGMGPYIEHCDTPMGCEKKAGLSLEKRLELALRMIALCRIVLKDVNIASTTALQSIGKDGRRLGLLAGANVLMPNITPKQYREDYLLYNNKPGVEQDAEDSLESIQKMVSESGLELCMNDWGDALHYIRRK